MDVAIQVVSSNRVGDDRAAAFPRANGGVLVVADGSGGTSGGAKAAEAVVAGVRGLVAASPAECGDFLLNLDRQLVAVGETTAVIVVVADNLMFGASAGDSCAWIVEPEGINDLTIRQKRKPLLGSGGATPVDFGPVARKGTLILGSDGLFKYVPEARIRHLKLDLPPLDAAVALVEAARLPSRSLQDDVAVIVARLDPDQA